MQSRLFRSDETGIVTFWFSTLLIKLKHGIVVSIHFSENQI